MAYDRSPSKNIYLNVAVNTLKKLRGLVPSTVPGLSSKLGSVGQLRCCIQKIQALRLLPRVVGTLLAAFLLLLARRFSDKRSPAVRLCLSWHWPHALRTASSRS